MRVVSRGENGAPLLFPDSKAPVNELSQDSSAWVLHHYTTLDKAWYLGVSWSSFLALKASEI
jgi:hypothetical protein